MLSMNILVAGGAGFIGSNLIEALLLKGHSVISVDNLSTGNERNLAHLRAHPELTEHVVDIVDGLPPMPALDVVFHLASPASPPGYVARPVETLRANSEGTRHLLEVAVKCGASFILASTSEIYGDPQQHPQSETYRGNVSSIGPRSMYDEGKRYAEALTMAYIRSHKANGRIVRIFNTYGPRSSPQDGRMVPNFIVQALTGQPLTVYGDGQQTRSICYVDDLVEGLISVALMPAARGEVINLGNPEEHTVLEFATLIRSLADSRSQVAFEPVAVGDDPQRRQPNIQKAATTIDWSPKVDLETGLRKTISYFRDLGSVVE